MLLQFNLRKAMVFALVLQCLWIATAFSADPVNPRVLEGVSNQDAIYRDRNEFMRPGYTIDRTLAAYADVLSSGFEAALAALAPADRWLDIGAGQGQAVLDYLSPEYRPQRPLWQGRLGGGAQVVAMSIEDRRTPVWRKRAESVGTERMRYVFGKRLREYTIPELGRFRIITDVIGGFSYTDDLSAFMNTVLGLLEMNGSFYTVLQDVHEAGGSNQPHYPKAPFLTEIVKSDGEKMKACAWLQSISCVKVTCEFKAHWKPPVEAYHVQKVCAETRVPTLTPVHYEPGTPPERRFNLKN